MVLSLMLKKAICFNAFCVKNRKTFYSFKEYKLSNNVILLKCTVNKKYKKASRLKIRNHFVKT